MKRLWAVALILPVLLVGCGKATVNNDNKDKDTIKQDEIVIQGFDAEEEKSEEEKPEKTEEKEEEKITTGGKIIVIDPGHQLHGDSKKEPNGPGASVMKARVTSGTTGVSTRVPEYVMNLSISLKLKTELEKRGYTVYMTRSVHEVSISNKERAQYATTVNADIAVRIHGNGSTNQSVRGAEVYVPGPNNPYVSHLANSSKALGTNVLNEYCKATGINNRGVFVSDTMTGMNWSTVPVIILEVGFMSNPTEDQFMQDQTVQQNMATGIANGIDKYFGY